MTDEALMTQKQADQLAQELADQGFTGTAIRPHFNGGQREVARRYSFRVHAISPDGQRLVYVSRDLVLGMAL